MSVQTRFIKRAKALRRNATSAEATLWNRLRDRQLGGFKFVRQIPIGRYVADFVCREHDLIIELDGGQHAESVRDIERDKVLAAAGYRVLRYWNNDIAENIEGVLENILAVLNNG